MLKEVFKIGTHTDSAGNTHEYTEQDLINIAEKYNNQSEHEAPIVIGHPDTNSPAYGWVKSLKYDNGSLYAEIVNTDKEFEKIVNEGRYKKVSIALYEDGLLRHVGYLGAIPPAVKGLKDASFNESNYKQIEFEQAKKHLPIILFMEYAMNDEMKAFIEKVLQFLSETFNEEVSNQTAKWINENFGSMEPPKEPANQNPNPNPDQTTQNSETPKYNESEFNELTLRLQKLEQENKEHKFNIMFNEMLNNSLVIPAQKDMIQKLYNESKAENKESDVLEIVKSLSGKHNFSDSGITGKDTPAATKQQEIEMKVKQYEEGR